MCYCVETDRNVMTLWRASEPPISMELFANQLRIGCWQEQELLLIAKLNAAVGWVERATRRAVMLRVVRERWRQFPCDSNAVSLDLIPIKPLSWLTALANIPADDRPVWREPIVTHMGEAPTSPVLFRQLVGTEWTSPTINIELLQNDRTNEIYPVPETCWPTNSCTLGCCDPDWNVTATYVAGYACQDEMILDDNAKVLDAVLMAGEVLYHGGEAKATALNSMLRSLAWKV